jgi:hypothetical protein
MDYVDATHLRFDGDTFISYAMLNQIERACALARLGNKQEALTALKQALGLDYDSELDLNDVDLKPLTKMREFKTLVK